MYQLFINLKTEEIDTLQVLLNIVNVLSGNHPNSSVYFNRNSLSEPKISCRVRYLNKLYETKLRLEGKFIFTQCKITYSWFIFAKKKYLLLYLVPFLRKNSRKIIFHFPQVGGAWLNIFR